MRRIGFIVLIVFALVAAMAGCGGSSFLGLNDRQAYLLLTPGSVEKVKLDTGATVGLPVTLDAPGGIRSICFRSQSGQLYGMGGDSIVYRVNAITGTCTAVSAAALAIDDALGVLYSSPDGVKLYYIAGSGRTYSINPNNGTIASTGAFQAYAPGDPSVASPGTGGASYSAAGNQLFIIDGANDVLAKMDTPLGGVLHTVGPLGVDVAGSSGLAIDPQLGKAYFTFDTGTPGLYRVDLATGASTQIGGASLGAGGIAIIP